MSKLAPAVIPEYVDASRAPACLHAELLPFGARFVVTGEAEIEADPSSEREGIKEWQVEDSSMLIGLNSRYAQGVHSVSKFASLDNSASGMSDGLALHRDGMLHSRGTVHSC